MQKLHLTALLGIVLAVFCAGCAPQNSVHELRGQAWGTTYQIKIVAGEDDFDEAAVRSALSQTLTAVDTQLSNWNDRSEVSRFNALSSGIAAELSPQFNDLMRIANRVHTDSDGYFDITLAPVIELWGFGSSNGEGPQNRSAPSDEAIAAAMKTVGQKTVLEHDFEGSQLQKLDPNATVFLSALAKGAGIDAIHESLTELGYDNFLIEVGGDLIAIGNGPGGKGWQIGIEQPRVSSGQPGRVLSLSNMAMATSGDYRNYFEQAGQRFSHIIDPRSGRPISHKTASVTVLSERAVLADAWATALLAAGEERGLAIAEREDIAALFIVRSGSNAEPEFRTVRSSGFDRLRAETQGS